MLHDVDHLLLQVVAELQSGEGGLRRTVVCPTTGERRVTLTKRSTGRSAQPPRPRRADTTMKTKRTKLRTLGYAKFVDPKDAGSMVAYHGPARYDAGVTLTFSDCTRMVSWSVATKGDRGIKKVQAAIDVLEKLKAELELGNFSSDED